MIVTGLALGLVTRPRSWIQSGCFVSAAFWSIWIWAVDRNSESVLTRSVASTGTGNTIRPVLVAVRPATSGETTSVSCAEIGVRGEYAVLQGKLNNAGGALLTRGGIPGAGLDAAILLGNWRLSAGGEYLSGTVERLDQYGPDFAQQSGSDPASIYGAGLRGSGRFGIVVIDLGLFWERAKLPWVSFAVLGLEQRLFEAGFRPSSDSTNKGLDLRVRVKVATGVYVQIFSRRGQASETVTFTDALDSRPPVTLAVRAPSRQQYMYGLGVTFALGSASAPNPAP